MCDCFNKIDADYQVTDLIENIDIARVLRENKKAGCEYVFIFTQTDFAVFFTKKFASRMEALDLMDVKDITDEGEYGFARIEETDGGQEGTLVQVTGNVIRSTGFIKYVNGSTCSHDLLRTIVENLDLIEEHLEADRQSKLAKMSVIKVVAG